MLCLIYSCYYLRSPYFWLCFKHSSRILFLYFLRIFSIFYYSYFISRSSLMYYSSLIIWSCLNSSFIYFSIFLDYSIYSDLFYCLSLMNIRFSLDLEILYYLFYWNSYSFHSYSSCSFIAYISYNFYRLNYTFYLTCFYFYSIYLANCLDSSSLLFMSWKYSFLV